MTGQGNTMAKIAPDEERCGRWPEGETATAAADGQIAVPDTPKAGEDTDKNLPKASMGKMLSLASSGDLLLLLVGIIGAIGNGCLQPIIILVWGDAIDGMAAPGYSTMNTNVTMVAAMADYQAKMLDAMMDDVHDKSTTMCILGAVATVVGAVQGFCFKKLSEVMQQKMLKQYYHMLIHQDVAWFDARDPAALPMQMVSDAQKFGDAWGDKLGTSFMGLGTFVAGYIFAFMRGWPIALTMTCSLPFLAVGAILMGAAMQDVQLETQSWYAKASAVAEETFYAMRTVVAFGGEPREIEKYSSAVTKARWGGVKNNIKIGAGLGYTMGVCFLAYALAFYVGMRFTYDEVDNPNTGEPWKGGEILGVFFCVLMASFMLGTIDPGVKAFETARVAAARFFATRDAIPEIQCRAQDLRKPITAIEKFELKEVHFAYPQRPELPVLNGLSLTIQQGQKVAVVGESGSGKSTVMALLERFYDPSAGEILVNGENIKNFSISALRKCIGYVGQEPVLFATSIRDNILQGASGPEAHSALEKVIVDAQIGFINDLPEKLETFVGSGGLQLSGGQKQRIAIARALIKQASVLFFDEATSALDNTSEKMIQETIDKLSTMGASTSESLTIVTIAHRLSTVRGADIIYVLSKGTLAESGAHEDLMAKAGVYHALVATQERAATVDDDASGQITTAAGADGPERQTSSQAKDLAASKTGALTDEDKHKEEEERQKQILKTYNVSMSRLLGFCKKEWCYFIPGLLGALYDGASQPVTGLLLVEAIFGFQKPKEEMKDHLEMVCIWFAILAAGEVVACTLSSGCFGLLGESLTMRLRIGLFSTIFEQEIGFHDDPQNSPGALTAALEIYAFRIATLCKAIGSKANAMNALVVGLAIAFYSCWQVSLVLLGSVPITIFANMLQMVVMLGGNANENDKLKMAQQLVSESVQNVRTVHACGIEGRLSALYAEKVNFSKTDTWRHMIAGLALGVSGGVMFFIMAGAFFYMSYLLKEGTADFRDLLVAFMCVFFAAMGAGQAAGMMGDASKATVAAHDAFQLLDRVSKINGLKNLGLTPGTDVLPGNIEFRAVKFHYPFRPDVQVLKGVSFSVQSGQSVGVAGPSGGGKSTVMSLLQRYYDPVEGGVFIGASKQALAEVNIRWWRQQVGYVGQEPILFNCSVRQNVKYGLIEGTTISDDQLEAYKKMSNLDFLEDASIGGRGWDTEVGPRGSHLSGGQKQRVAICRALVKNPPILLLDEATSALDSQSEKVVQEALEAARMGRTSFAIAHRLSTIQACDIIMVVAEGVILESGSHDELMTKEGVYCKLQEASRG
jgi:ATP-binding cassette subfamily B (MDR/TAP) protein 1